MYAGSLSERTEVAAQAAVVADAAGIGEQPSAQYFNIATAGPEVKVTPPRRPGGFTGATRDLLDDDSADAMSVTHAMRVP